MPRKDRSLPELAREGAQKARGGLKRGSGKAKGMEQKEAIMELNSLWRPIRPYLAQHVAELYGRHDGKVLEIGPFSGLALELARRDIGTSFHVAAFPGAIAETLKDEARELGLVGKVTIAESDEGLMGVPRETFNLIIFRGAFFFPSFFSPDLFAIYGCLKAGGMALLGGGFGRHTPEHVIKGVEKRSKALNQALGRVRITDRDLWPILEGADLKERATIIIEGGLWVVVRKGSSPRMS